MNATDILMAEHRVIEQVLCCLEKLAEGREAGKQFDKASAREAIDFFRHFADRCHHGKEEGHLFPLLEARGLPREGGPTGVMLHEHEEGRRLLAAMVEALDSGSSDEFARPARAYVRLLREHIRKEDHCLFPMADEILSPAEAESLSRSFEGVESAEMGEGTHEHYLDLANALADKFGVPRAGVVPPCCHHR